MTHLAVGDDPLSKAELKVLLDHVESDATAYSPSELAPLLVGDFNGQHDDSRLASWFDFQEKSVCADGTGKTSTESSERIMAIYVGERREGTPFARTAGSLKVLRRSFATSGGKIVDGLGIKIPHIWHPLLGYAFGVDSTSPVAGCPTASPDYCGPPDGNESSCTNLASNIQSCGLCSYRCGSGEKCNQGACCSAGETFCSGACSSLATDNGNCGACGHECGRDQHCAGGNCVAHAACNHNQCSPTTCKCGKNAKGVVICAPTVEDCP